MRNRYSNERGGASSPWLKPGDSALALIEKKGTGSTSNLPWGVEEQSWGKSIRLADESNGEPQLLNGHVTPSSRRPIVTRSRRRAAEVAGDGELGRAAEHRAQDVVSFADVLRTTPSRDQREDLLGFFGRHGAVLVADVGQIT